MAQDIQTRFETLYHISQSLNSSLDLDEVLEMVMDRLVELTRAERGFLMFVEDSGELRFAVARNLERESVDAPEFEVSRTLVRKVIESNKGELLLSALEDPRFKDAKSVVAKGLRSIVCVPLALRERVLGAVYVDNRLQAGVFKKEDLEMLGAFANLAAIAIENARLYSELRQRMTEILTMKSYQDAIFESVESGIVAIDEASHVKTFNRSAERIFALGRDKVLDQPLREALHGRAADMFADLIQDVAASHKPILGHMHEGYFVGAGPVNLRLNLTPLRNAEGEEMGVTMIVDDISEQLRLEAELDAEEAERRKLKETLGKLVSSDVADLAERTPDMLSLEGQTREVSILFADLVGFSTRSEQLPAADVIRMLNRYFSEMCAVVARNHGMVKQFVGDEIMVLFNATKDQPDHASLAVWTAIEMVDRLRELAAEDPEGKDGFYDVKVGVHTGEVVVGGVGTQDRMEFAAVGDNVNLASRVMGLAPKLGAKILITEATYFEVYRRVATGVRFNARGAQEVKGRQNLIKVYEITRPSWE